MNLNHLAIFHAVAQTGNVSQGAERLHISQPAVSKQLQEFERSLGTRLFDRLPRGMRLTESGAALAEYARRIFALEAEAETVLAEQRGLERGTLVVGASLTIGGYLLPGMLARFHRLYPGIQIQAEVANTDVIQRRMAEGTLDVGLIEGFVELPHLQATVFREDRMIAIAPPDHPISGEHPVTAERLCREDFVVREAGSGTRAVIEQALAQRGLRLRPVMSLADIEAVKRAVAAGVGLAIVSELTVDQELELGRVIRVPVADLDIRRPLHRLQLPGRYESRAARAFAAMLED